MGMSFEVVAALLQQPQAPVDLRLQHRMRHRVRTRDVALPLNGPHGESRSNVKPPRQILGSSVARVESWNKTRAHGDLTETWSHVVENRIPYTPIESPMCAHSSCAPTNDYIGIFESIQSYLQAMR
jgi:hypothetical protein